MPNAVIEIGLRGGRTKKLKLDETIITIGRDENKDTHTSSIEFDGQVLALGGWDFASVSNPHISLRWDGRRYTIRDLESKKGSIIDGDYFDDYSGTQQTEDGMVVELGCSSPPITFHYDPRKDEVLDALQQIILQAYHIRVDRTWESTSDGNNNYTSAKGSDSRILVRPEFKNMQPEIMPTWRTANSIEGREGFVAVSVQKALGKGTLDACFCQAVAMDKNQKRNAYMRLQGPYDRLLEIAEIVNENPWENIPLVMDEFCGWTNRSKRQRKRESGEITRIDPTGARKNRRALGRHPNLMEEIARVYTSIEGKLTKVEYGR